MPNPSSYTVFMGSVLARSASIGDWWSEIPLSSGTFSNLSSSIITASRNSADGIELWEINPPNNGSLVPSVGGTASITFGLDHTAIQLDTGTVDYFALPSGFQILSMTFKIHINNPGSSQAVTIKVNGQVVAGPSNAVTYNVAIKNPNFFDFNDSFEIDVITKSGTIPPSTSLLTAQTGLAIEVIGSCGIAAGSSTLTLVNPSSTYHNGDNIRITSIITAGGLGYGGTGVNLKNITQVTLKYIDGSGNWITINIPQIGFTLSTSTEINFPFPNIGTISPSSVSVSLVDDGTQFNGSVLLGYLTAIVSTDNSGIYQFTVNKPNDTLYIAGGTTTSAVAIVNPFVETAFIP